MKKLISLALLSISNFASADIFWFVRDENGYTNWQYVANFSSGILIIVLSLLAVWPLRDAEHSATTASWRKFAPT